jgi:hypothetical protein
VFLLAVPGVLGCSQGRDKARVSNDLRQLALAMQNYHSTTHTFPSAGYGTQGPPEFQGLSWRVAVLPYVEEDNLYKEIYNGQFGRPGSNPKEFWNNPALLNRRPPIYGTLMKDPQATCYRVFVGNGAAFEKDRALGEEDFPKGTSTTILIVEAGEAVPWTKPDELLYDPDKPLPALGGHFRDGFYAAFADGTVKFIPKTTDEKTIRGMIVRAGGK